MVQLNGEKIKISGLCGLSSALTCALVTVTTTVIHMSRLKALRECEYTRKTQTCTCYATESSSRMLGDGNGNIAVNDDGNRIVSFEFKCLAYEERQC